MSFSAEVKKELSQHIDGSRHCRLAELAAILSHEGKLLTQGKKDRSFPWNRKPAGAKKVLYFIR